MMLSGPVQRVPPADWCSKNVSYPHEQISCQLVSKPVPSVHLRLDEWQECVSSSE